MAGRAPGRSAHPRVRGSAGPSLAKRTGNDGAWGHAGRSVAAGRIERVRSGWRSASYPEPSLEDGATCRAAIERASALLCDAHASASFQITRASCVAWPAPAHRSRSPAPARVKAPTADTWVDSKRRVVGARSSKGTQPSRMDRSREEHSLGEGLSLPGVPRPRRAGCLGDARASRCTSGSTGPCGSSAPSRRAWLPRSGDPRRTDPRRRSGARSRRR
jgi:hypothetical protein